MSHEEHVQDAIKAAMRTWHYRLSELVVCLDCNRVHRAALRACPSCTGKHNQLLSVVFSDYRYHEESRMARAARFQTLVARKNAAAGVAA